MEPNKKWQTCLTFIVLVGGFLCITSWFSIVDVYHKHFFDDGLIVFVYNLFRLCFCAYLTWIIFISGYAIIATFVPVTTRKQFSSTERIVLGFATGLGAWHLLMFILGICNLYYQSIVIPLCAIILAASVPAFLKNVTHFYAYFHPHKPLSETIKYNIINSILISIALLWLLMVRGLYPGGGGDYYTHYFYYYMQVLQNHGLAPNDVWYHYYYSKGAGLHFLGMLMTDPEAPQLITFSCFSIATLALASLTARFAPRSLWPACCAILYILYNLVTLNGNGGGEFQKTHEETSAIVVMAICILSLYHFNPKQWQKPAVITVSALIISAAILTQATAIIFGFFFATQIILAVLQKKSAHLRFYFILASIAAVSCIAIFVLNYFVTGLATDQALNLTWRFANLERLNQWGVIPNIMMIAWIRDNYDLVAVPWGVANIRELISFMRADVLWILFTSTLFALSVQLIISYKNNKPITPLLRVIGTISIVIVTFTIFSFFAGHSQSVSYYRFCSFFFPILTLFCVLSWSFINTQRHVSQIILPSILFLAVVFSWHHWHRQTTLATKSAKRFLLGSYSLADAYTHQPTGLGFGGINPGAYQAKLHTPPGSRIWSTSIDTYCMAPDCKIESVISFKLSSHLNEILNGHAEQAKHILQQEGLNYFLFTDHALLLDFLPYSQLFNSKNISKYFGIKWTNGNTYLLTWRGPETKPIDKHFLDAYNKHLNLSEHPWFRFSKAVPQLDSTMKVLMNSPHPWHPIVFPWRKKPTPIDDITN